MKQLLIGLLVFLSSITICHARETITWMVLDWPPWMILDGDDRGEGRFNHILAVAQERLSEYDHVTERMNWARFWQQIEDNVNICYTFGLKRGDREQIAHFSAPHTIVLPNAVIMKKETAQRLGNPDSISIRDLLEDTTLSGHAEKNRSFTSEVDSLMQAYETGSSLTRVAASPESLIKMILAGRIDYTIEYPIVASYYQKKFTIPGELVSIPIAEMAPYSYVYMNCTRNEWGRKVVERWNEELKKLKPTDRYREITEIGHTEENELAQIRSYYEAFIEAEK